MYKMIKYFFNFVLYKIMYVPDKKRFYIVIYKVIRLYPYKDTISSEK